MASSSTVSQKNFVNSNAPCLLHSKSSRIAWVTSAVVATLLVFLAASRLLGPPGSPGFIASLTFGTGLLALDTVILIVAIRSKEVKQPPPPTSESFLELPAELQQLVLSKLSLKQLLQSSTSNSVYYEQVQEVIKVRAREYGWEDDSIEEASAYLKKAFSELKSLHPYGQTRNLEAIVGQIKEEHQNSSRNEILLRTAYFKKFTHAIQLLLSLGVDPNDDNNTHDFSLLHLAASDAKDQLVDLLIRSKANVNAQNVDGQTPLLRTIRDNFSESHISNTISLLIEHGADPSIHDKYGLSPLYYAVRNRFQGIVTLLLKNPSVVEKINSKDDQGYSPLHRLVNCTIDESVLEITKLLIEAGADVNSQSNFNETPLCSAVLTHFLIPNQPYNRRLNDNVMQLLELLLGKGADPNALDSMGRRPLHILVSCHNKEAVALLLRYKANPSLVDYEGHNAYFYAKDEEMQQLLSNSDQVSE